MGSRRPQTYRPKVSFDAYLREKRIDPVAFARSLPEVYKSWMDSFTYMVPETFTDQNIDLLEDFAQRFRLRDGSKMDAEQVPQSSRPSRGSQGKARNGVQVGSAQSKRPPSGSRCCFDGELEFKTERYIRVMWVAPEHQKQRLFLHSVCPKINSVKWRHADDEVCEKVGGHVYDGEHLPTRMSYEEFVKLAESPA